MPRNRQPKAIATARAARKRPSVAERIVWECLRNRRHGIKIRREYPVGPYRLDFYCPSARLGLELDGEQHDPVRDLARDEYLRTQGIEVVRIANREFFALDLELGETIDGFLRRCRERIEDFGS